MVFMRVSPLQSFLSPGVLTNLSHRTPKRNPHSEKTPLFYLQLVNILLHDLIPPRCEAE